MKLKDLKNQNLNKPFYITTTLPYVNGRPHIGFAMEVIRTDVIARWKRLTGHDVFFNTGTDEHGIKIFKKAKEEGMTPQQYVDQMAIPFKEIKETLNISYDKFIRTTDRDHEQAAQKFWSICRDNGFIYKKKYSGLYCSGCEMFLTEKDLINGKCPNHTDRNPETIEEENYFFKYSAFADHLLALYETSDFVIPDFRLNEIRNQVKNGLEDFSISRIKEKMPWGVSIPDDDTQVMYVWFDALVNYISTLGWPDSENFKKYWEEGTPVQYCGKDNLQHQAARWQAMLKSVGVKPSRQIIVDGFINFDGEKISKSLGNTVDPIELSQKYSIDSLRYFVTRELHPFEDSDFTIERFEEAHNANLANGIGNLTNRIMKMAEDNIEKLDFTEDEIELSDEYLDAFREFNLSKGGDIIWKMIGEADSKIAETKPFSLIKTEPDKAKEIIKELVEKLFVIAIYLKPFLPQTSDKILEAISQNKKPETPIFGRV
jgi:methionyl-tRNA synthetase